MALDFLSAPASSVDAERAFSGGRLQVGHLQHNMSSQTFKARVALASWINTPFFPPGVPASIIADSRKPKAKEAKSNGKGKAKEVIIESHEDFIEIDDSDSD
ncbi:hypothetical protein BDZ97DRAFT_1665906 [Flammula alnicola]|nr:hypothetical protein BDZ97DRAFT_1665906 [Flammula alnicola]